MNIEKLIKDLDPVIIIEFKNYLIENLSRLCSAKNSNSKIISNFKTEENFCKKCGCLLHKNGKTKTGVQKYICGSCKSTSSATTLNMNLSNWKLTNTLDLSYLFDFATKAVNVNLDFSGWNTSRVTNMKGMFSDTGINEVVTNGSFNISPVFSLISTIKYKSGIGTKKAPILLYGNN